MGFTTALDGLTIVAIALAVILSGLVSLVGSSARRQAVSSAKAAARDLSELTGIMDFKELQDIFGPPGLNRTWQTLTLDRVLSERRMEGYLMSSQRLDWLCIAVALLSFFSGFVLIEIGLLVALGAQITGWVYAAKLPR